MGRRKNAKKAVYFCVILILVLGMIFSGLRILESTVFSPGQRPDAPQVRKTITRDGVEYFPRQDITVVLVLGIDEEGPVASSGSYRNAGEADMVMLVILDQRDESCSVLCLNRDMMLPMPVLGIGGKPAGTAYGQLALAHTYGEGLADSCENTRTAVSDFLGGITIDHYVAMNMDAVAIVTDAVGGVAVQVTEDFSRVDDSIPIGQVTLSGKQALNYVRSRKAVDDQLNVSRMSRQGKYMQGLMEAMADKLEQSETFAVKLHDLVADFVVTDCSASVFSALMERCAGYPLKEIVTPEGEFVQGEAYCEFYAEEETLDALILRLLYGQKD